MRACSKGARDICAKKTYLQLFFVTHLLSVAVALCRAVGSPLPIDARIGFCRPPPFLYYYERGIQEVGVLSYLNPK